MKAYCNMYGKENTIMVLFWHATRVNDTNNNDDGVDPNDNNNAYVSRQLLTITPNIIIIIIMK